MNDTRLSEATTIKYGQYYEDGTWRLAEREPNPDCGYWESGIEILTRAELDERYVLIGYIDGNPRHALYQSR